MGKAGTEEELLFLLGAVRGFCCRPGWGAHNINYTTGTHRMGASFMLLIEWNIKLTGYSDLFVLAKATDEKKCFAPKHS